MVKLRLSKEFLKTLPHIPSQKTRLRRLAAERAAAAAAANASQGKQSTPIGGGDQDKTTLSNFKINLGLKGDSTAGLVMNTVTTTLLDKTGRPCRKWVKRPRPIKLFSGFKLSIMAFSTDEIDGAAEVDAGTSVKSENGEVATAVKVESVLATPELLLEA